MLPPFRTNPAAAQNSTAMTADVTTSGGAMRSRLPLVAALTMTALSVGLLVAWIAINLTMPASVPRSDSDHFTLLFACPRWREPRWRSC